MEVRIVKVEEYRKFISIGNTPPYVRITYEVAGEEHVLEMPKEEYTYEEALRRIKEEAAEFARLYEAEISV